jgi:hypothetical protein
LPDPPSRGIVGITIVIMKPRLFVIAVNGLALPFFLAGCAHRPAEARLTNPDQPGPALGYAVGTVAGTVGGQVAGGVVGAGEGAVAAMKAPFHNEHRIVRTWRTEKTSDGRTIQVPVDTEVDAYGRPVNPPEPPTPAKPASAAE